MHPNPILICDPSPEFLAGLQNAAATTPFPILGADTFPKAQQALGQTSRALCAIFLNPSLASSADTLTLIGLAHQKHPAVPVFFLYDPQGPFRVQVQGLSEEDLVRSGLQPKLVQKPVSFAELVKLVNPMLVPEALKAAPESESPNPGTLHADDAKFFCVRADRFMTGAKSLFDVYVRLGSGRYVKILRAGDTFSPDRILSYINKGVRYLYLTKEAQQKYVELGDRLAKSIMFRESIPVEVKVAKTMHAGEEAIKLLQSIGINSDNIKYAVNYVTNISAVVKQLDLGKREQIQGFIKALTNQEHSTGVSMISALIARQLKYEYRDSVNTIGLASLFHDIGLDDELACTRNEDTNQMSAHQRKLFLIHPTAGAMMLKDIRSIHPLVPQAIEQHHERRDKSGFPQNLGGNSIHQIAEIIGLADEFFRCVKLAETQKDYDPFEAIQRKNLESLFSPVVVNAFKAAFEANAATRQKKAAANIG